jgi:hypothetical protein
MHLTAPLHWSRSIGTNGRDPSELVVTIAGMRKVRRWMTGGIPFGRRASGVGFQKDTLPTLSSYSGLGPRVSTGALKQERN